MLDGIDRAVCALNRWLLIGLLAVMALLVFGNVVGRYVFSVSSSMVEEITRYMMIWLVYLGAGLALRGGQHVSVNLVIDALTPALARLLRAIALLATLAFMAAVLWYGWQYAQFAMSRLTPVLQWPIGAVYLAVPLGALLFIVHAAFVARILIAGGYEGAPAVHEFE